MKHLVLIGFMGSGKTTLAHKLALHLSLPIFSTDFFIEEQMQMSIAEIFDRFGELFFRAKEDEVFAQIQTLNSLHIIDCGGGFGAYQAVEKLGKVVFLNIELEEIIKRLSQEEKAKRPLCDLKIKERFEERVSLYANKADLIFKQSDDLEVLLHWWNERD